MGESASYDHGKEVDYPECLTAALTPSLVLTSDYAVLLAEEFNRNPVINDEAAFDIYPSSVVYSTQLSYSICLPRYLDLCHPTRLLCRYVLRL